jgi:hypothetical protein
MIEDLLDVTKYEIRVKKCNRIAWWWKTVNWIVGILGIGASAFAAAKLFNNDWDSLASVIATICFGFMGFANPMKQSINYDKAANRLEIAIERYKNRLITLREFVVEYEIARSVTVGEGGSKLAAAPNTTDTNAGVGR